MKPIVVINNPDKESHHLDKKEPNLMPSFPSKVCIAGRSGSGKSTAALNLIGRTNPPFERIVVVHGDTETHEYDLCEPELVDSLEGLVWDPTIKNLCVIEEQNVMSWNRKQKGELERFLNYTCSHKSVSAILVVQNFTSLLPVYRRAMDWWVIYPSVSMDAVDFITRTTGDNFRELMKMCENKFNSITWDFSGNGPRLRLDLFQKIKDDHDDN